MDLTEERQMDGESERRSEGQLALHHRAESRPVRVLKPVSLAPYKPRHIDPTVVAFDYYDSFNYSILSAERANLRLTVGITSANPGEGKTLVASNLAVSLALAHERRTLLIDLNVKNPRVDDVFGIPRAPGLTEALKGGEITVWPTQIEHLFVLPVGGRSGSTDGNPQPLPRPRKGDQGVRLNQLSAFRDMLYSLEQEYDFIVVDVPAINGRDFPILYAGQLEGLLVVIDTKGTTRKDVEKLFRVVNEKQILGFVLNRFRED